MLVFISHAASEADVARRVCEALERRVDLHCWIAPRDVRSDRTYGVQILDAIEACDVFVLVVTPGIDQSDHVEREVERAAHYRKRIIPLIVDGHQPAKRFEYYLAGWQRYPFPAGLDDAFVPELRSDKTSVEATATNSEAAARVTPRWSQRAMVATAASALAVVAIIVAYATTRPGPPLSSTTPPNEARPNVSTPTQPVDQVQVPPRENAQTEQPASKRPNVDKPADKPVNSGSRTQPADTGGRSEVAGETGRAGQHDDATSKVPTPAADQTADPGRGNPEPSPSKTVEEQLADWLRDVDPERDSDRVGDMLLCLGTNSPNARQRMADLTNIVSRPSSRELAKAPGCLAKYPVRQK